MKKIIVLCLTLASLLVACQPDQTADSKMQEVGAIRVNSSSGPEALYVVRVATITWKGHTYIQFGAHDDLSIEHDPECFMKDLAKLGKITIDTLIVQPVVQKPDSSMQSPVEVDSVEVIGW